MAPVIISSAIACSAIGWNWRTDDYRPNAQAAALYERLESALNAAFDVCDEKAVVSIPLSSRAAGRRAVGNRSAGSRPPSYKMQRRLPTAAGSSDAANPAPRRRPRRGDA